MNTTPENSFFQIMKLVIQYHTLNTPLSVEVLEPFLNPHLTLRSITKGDYITTINTPVKKVYYVVSGTFSMVRSSKDGKNTIRIINAPSFLGIDCTVLDYDDFYPDNRALENCLVLEIDQEYFINSIKQNGELCFEILHEICQKFYHASFRYDQTLFYDPPTKLMIYIINHWLANHKNQKKHMIKVTNSRIAEEIGISIRTFYRAVNKLKTENLISIVSGNICVTQEQINKLQSLLIDSKDTAALPTFLSENNLTNSLTKNTP